MRWSGRYGGLSRSRSAISLLEMAILTSEGKLKLPLNDFLDELQANPLFRILPLTYEVASEVGSLGGSCEIPPIERSLQPPASTACGS